MANVLADQPGPVHLDEVAFLQQANGLVHLSHQPGHGCLACARVAEENKMLAGWNLGQTMLSTPALDLKEGDLGPHLFFYRVKTDQLVQISLDLIQSSKVGLGQRQVLDTAIKAAIGGRGPDCICGLKKLLCYIVTTGRHPYSVGHRLQSRAHR